MKVELTGSELKTTCRCGSHITQLIVDGVDLTPMINAEAEKLKDLLRVVYIAMLPRIPLDSEVGEKEWSIMEQTLENALEGKDFDIPVTWPR